ncbi:head-tail connector protein [Mycobacterium phage ThulaThula]|uniref:Uncharacterized protein n=1 Tax=Mycobacterium phage ThulaThula TaxID=2599880 RepID=A0A5J6TH72_9CAUD|nr:head-tail connector protein [Mycobacterium phage ThulaThula]QFG09039.1 hypothetical protein PBI_THULATHULA_10 [Mycobacterium phage ThulaThula]
MQYNISDELVVIRDGAAVHYTSAQVGQSIELTDDEAAPLLADGKVLPTHAGAVIEVPQPADSKVKALGHEPVDVVEADQDTDED